MKRAFTFTLALSSALLAAPSVAAEEKARFESTGFLQSLDLFISRQIANLREGNQAPKTESAEDLKLSLRDAKAQKQAGFLYLNDSSASAAGTGSGASRPDFSSLLSPAGGTYGSIERQLMGSSSLLGISFGQDPGSGFNVGLSSEYRLSESGFIPTSGNFSDLLNREMNVGMSVGYSGFNIDASILRRDSLLGGDGLGYDVGLSYSGDSWSARLSLSEYRKGIDLLGLENESRNIISVELGASYKLTNSLGVQGGVRVYDYGQRVLVNPEAGERSQMVFLGGTFNF